MGWLHRILEESINYKKPIVIINTLDVRERVADIPKQLFNPDTISLFRKLYPSGRLPTRILINQYTTLGHYVHEIRIVEDRVKYESAFTPFEDSMAYINAVFGYIRSKIKSELENLNARLKEEEEEVEEGIKSFIEEHDPEIIVLAGLPESEEFRNLITNVLKGLSTDMFYTLQRSLTWLFIVDNSYEPPRDLLQTGYILFTRLFSTEEDVEAKIRLLREIVEIDDTTATILKDNLVGLPLSVVEDIITYITMTRDFDVRKIAEIKARALAEVLPFVEYVKLKTSFNEIGGYNYVKELLRRRFIAVVRNPEKARRYGLKPGRGVIFFGPPGTGKSTFAKALAKELGLPAYRISETVFSAYYGETERNLKIAISAIEASAPAVIVFDECDRLFAKRGSLQEHEVTRRVKDMLLEWMADPDRRTIIVATTNLIEDLDEAFLRPERIELIVPIFYPDIESRKEILKIHIRDAPHRLTEEDFKKLAEKTAWWTGDDLRYLCELAKTFAFEEESEYVDFKHFEEALNRITIDTAHRKELSRKMLETVKRYTRDKKLIELVEKQAQLVEAKPRERTAIDLMTLGKIF